jgi:fumarate reductase flavoprotein subunit
MQNGACVGVDAVQGGKPVRLEAKAVVIADGGFSANVDMIRRYITPQAERMLMRGTLSATGDGLRMAEAVGVHMGGFGQFYGHPVHREAYTKSNANLWPFPMLDPLIQVSIVVGSDGKRFADEGRNGIVLSNTMAQLADPLSTTLIFDDKLWNSVGKESASSPNPMLATAGGTLFKAADLKALAGMAGLPADALAATVAGYNKALASGAADKLDPPRTMAPIAARAIEQAPFYAMPLCSGITATMGGIMIDTECRAHRADGSAIAGLYAAGSTVAGIEGGAKVAYMGGLSKAFIFGLLAGEAIARAAGKTSPVQ